MNAIRQTQLLNKRELENATPPSASWHVDYRDTAWLFVGGLPLDLSEGDVVTIFSQFGNPTHLNLIRDKETGKSKGFGFLKYEDQRSCDLAVDNLGGADVLGRSLRVDHTRYKRKEGEEETTYRIDRLAALAEAEETNGNGSGKRASDTEDSEDDRRSGKRRKTMLREERELEAMLSVTQGGDEEDPMKDYLIRQKREEVEKVRGIDEKRRHKHHHRRSKEGEPDGRDVERQHRHRHRHRSPHEDNDRRERRREKDDGDDSQRHKPKERRRSRSRDRDYR
jgi:RNA-binding motif protein, X-linked 2